MNGFDSIDASSINRVRINPKQTNEVGNASSLVGLWILLPLAISGLAFVGIHIVMTIFFGNSVTINWNQVLLISWLLVSTICQTIYWMRITKSLGLISFAGLWSLVPIIGWIKTFQYAHSKIKSFSFDYDFEKDRGYVNGTNTVEPESEGETRGHEYSDLNRDSVTFPELVASRIASDNLKVQVPGEKLQKPRKVGNTWLTLRKMAQDFMGTFRSFLCRIVSSCKKFFVSRKKEILVIGFAILLALIGFFVGRPNYNDYKAKSSASKLISELQAVMNTSERRPLDFSTYADKLNPSFDNFLAAGSYSWTATNTNCNDTLYNDLRYTFGELRQADNSFNLYPETIIGLLNMYIKSCE
jgi:hypothetical protein